MLNKKNCFILQIRRAQKANMFNLQIQVLPEPVFVFYFSLIFSPNHGGEAIRQQVELVLERMRVWLLVDSA